MNFTDNFDLLCLLNTQSKNIYRSNTKVERGLVTELTFEKNGEHGGTIAGKLRKFAKYVL